MTVLPAEQRALLRAVIAGPDADTPRLVYADWLEDHGDEVQAEYIRESIDLFRMRSDLPGRAERESRQVEVADEHGPTWLGRLGIHVRTTFDRGFPEHLEFPLHYDFFDHLDRGLFDVAPVRGAVIGAEKDFGLVYEDVRRLAATPELARLRLLQLHGSSRAWAAADHDPGAWPAFFRSDAARGLRQLTLVNCIADDDAVALADSPALAGLTFLAIGAAGLGPSGLRAIARSQHLSGVKTFWLVGNRFDGTEAEEREVTAELAGRFGDGYQTDWAAV